jgi:hypothetical protein
MTPAFHIFSKKIILIFKPNPINKPQKVNFKLADPKIIEILLQVDIGIYNMDHLGLLMGASTRS